MIRTSPLFHTHTHTSVIGSLRFTISTILYLIITLCIIITPKNIYGQACDVLTLKSDEVVFLFDDNYYRDGSTVIICESSLPLPLELQKYGQPSSAIDVTWISGVDDKETNPTSTSIDHFSKKREIMTNKIEASILGDKDVYKVTVKIINDVDFDADETRKKASYGADENSNNGYPTHPGIGLKSLPYKWLPTFGSDDAVLKVIPSNTSIKNHLKINNTNNWYSAGNIQDPYSNFIQHTLYNDQIPYFNNNKIDVCFEETYIAHINTTKVLNVEILSLCDTDDDTPNYCLTDPSLLPDCITPISDPNHECINRGIDGTLDLYYNTGNYQRLPASKLNDSARPVDNFIMDNQKRYDLKVHPSFIVSPLFTNPYFCNTPLPITTTNPCSTLTSIEINKIEDDLNLIYNQIGIDVIVDYYVLNTNYDVEIDDDILTKTEQISLHAMLKNTNRGVLAPFNKTQVWLTNLNGVAGSATQPIGNNSLSVDLIASNARTIAHEIGHSKYELYHPDGSSQYFDGTSSGTSENGWNLEGLLDKPVTNDIKNFMVSGFKFVAPDRSTPPVYSTDKKLIPKLPLIRPYHWSLIHSNH